jgi:hypothetical protein
MRSTHPLSGLIHTYSEETGADKAQQGPIRQGKRTDIVTDVKRLRALLKACREALKDGEPGRADRILIEALRTVVQIQKS